MNAQIISFRCILRSRTGQLISSSINRDVLTDLPGAAVPLPGLARALRNLKKGERRRVLLSAKEAYGFYDPAKVILIPRRLLPKGRLQIGQPVTVVSKTGQARSYRILQLFKDMAQLDGNHPLAGQDLSFDIEALDVREATPEEVSEAVGPGPDEGLH